MEGEGPVVVVVEEVAVVTRPKLVLVVAAPDPRVRVVVGDSPFREPPDPPECNQVDEEERRDVDDGDPWRSGDVPCSIDEIGDKEADENEGDDVGVWLIPRKTPTAPDRSNPIVRLRSRLRVHHCTVIP